MKQQLSREPNSLPTLMLNHAKSNIFEMTIADIHLENYQSHGPIKATMAV
jgi:thymidylate synthase